TAISPSATWPVSVHEFKIALPHKVNGWHPGTSVYGILSPPFHDLGPFSDLTVLRPERDIPDDAAESLLGGELRQNLSDGRLRLALEHRAHMQLQGAEVDFRLPHQLAHGFEVELGRLSGQHRRVGN